VILICRQESRDVMFMFGCHCNNLYPAGLQTPATRLVVMFMNVMHSVCFYFINNFSNVRVYCLIEVYIH